MWRLISCVFLAHFVAGAKYQEDGLCGNVTERARACAAQILGHEHADIDSCTITIPYRGNSNECKAMNFGPFGYNADIGGVRLQPYIWLDRTYTVNRTVLNITFTNIKWKTMNFRFQLATQQKILKNHCRSIYLSNDVAVNDQSVLYYDCYWSGSEDNFTGQSHLLDFEASDGKNINRGQYYFNIPALNMLSASVTEEEWLPFLYIEILNHQLRLHINPPPQHLNINGYEIKTVKAADKGTQVDNISIYKLKNSSKEVTFDYSLLNNGLYHFVVTPLHEKCQMIDGREEKCRSMKSPSINITLDTSEVRGVVCIASLCALVVGALFASYVVVRGVRHWWCREPRGQGAGAPPHVLLVWGPGGAPHEACARSLAAVLRAECGLTVSCAPDVALTAHRDPYRWAQEAFRSATHFVYVVGPPADGEPAQQPLVWPESLAVSSTPHRRLDELLLSLLRAERHRPRRGSKDVLNVFLEHSAAARVPSETRYARSYRLLKDWQKLVAHLSMNLIPKQHLAKSERGKMFLDDLAKAKKLLGERSSDKILV